MYIHTYICTYIHTVHKYVCTYYVYTYTVCSHTHTYCTNCTVCVHTYIHYSDVHANTPLPRSKKMSSSLMLASLMTSSINSYDVSPYTCRGLYYVQPLTIPTQHPLLFECDHSHSHMCSQDRACYIRTYLTYTCTGTMYCRVEMQLHVYLCTPVEVPYKGRPVIGTPL